ncbi:hypothetical protein BDZ45DRAFT_798951 [Acephala macrosclerotiorum]|nr:hypothetical protein BDZ45DRAFT_798951 [Acephala macrosclerotiorum]
MDSKIADTLPRRSVDSVSSPAEAVLDPDEIACLLELKGHDPRTHDATFNSRGSTPLVVPDAKHWIQQIEYLQKSSYLSATFVLEEWRQKNIIDDQYWKIEADHWESYYHDSFHEKCKRGQNWQKEDLPQSQQAQHNLSFFQHTSQFEWLSTYTQLTSKTSAIPQDEIHKSVFDTIYHCHRARYWQSLCEKRGYTESRRSIQAIIYWKIEFGYLNREIVRLEKKSLETESKPAQRKKILAKNINSSSPTKAKKSSRPQGRGKKAPKTSSMATGTRKSERLIRREAGCK